LAAGTQQEVDTEEEISSSKTQREVSQPKDSDIALSIKALAEESLQISELTEMEKTYAAEVISLLKAVIEPLNNTFHIKPTSLSKTDSSIQDVVLTPQSIVVVMHSTGTINSRPLESFSTEILMRIIAEVVPEAKRFLVEKRQKITGRVSSLEKIAREFRKLPMQAAAGKQANRSAVKSQLTAQSAEQPVAATAATTNNNNQPPQDALKTTIER
jgi:hypothetical protein